MQIDEKQYKPVVWIHRRHGAYLWTDGDDLDSSKEVDVFAALRAAKRHGRVRFRIRRWAEVRPGIWEGYVKRMPPELPFP